MLILFIYLRSFSVLLSITSDPDKFNIHRLKYWVKVAMFLEVAILLPLIHAGMGLFSSDNLKNEFLLDSRLNMYLTFTQATIQIAMIPIVAVIINLRRKWDKQVVLYILLTSTISLVAGSKGGGLLTILAILSLVKVGSNAAYIKLLRLPIIFLTALFSSIVYFVGGFFHIDPYYMISLMFSRLFLGNDARALAIDYSSQTNEYSISLFRESFRFLSSILGLPPVNPTLGKLLFVLKFSSAAVIDTAANSSSTALLIAYGDDYEKLLFSIVLCFLAIMIFMIIRMRNKYSIVTAAIGIALLSTLSQDILAFQITMNIVVAACVVIFLFVFVRYALVGASHPIRTRVVSSTAVGDSEASGVAGM